MAISTHLLEWTFGERLRKARRIAGLTQQDMAELLGVATNRYGNWEAGVSNPRQLVHVARQVADITEVPVTWLLGVEDTEEGYPRINSCYPADISVPFMFAPHQAGDDN